MDQPFPLHRWLTPLAALYAMGVNFRNQLFDWGLLRSKSFNIPTICVGNLAVGGTGKTPHTEYLIRLLQGKGLNVATLSRGYGRKTKGYLLADERANAQTIGDEPMQMKTKFPDVQVAVSEDRCHGIEQLLKLSHPRVDVVLLDDAFQHRYVKAGLNLLLTDYNRLLCDDALMPVGRLREPISGKNRAQIVIVTKCPDTITPIDFNIVTKRLELYPYQQLYFSRIGYGKLKPLFPQLSTLNSQLSTAHSLLVTGIANPTPLAEEMERRCHRVELMAFDDHHPFSPRDLQRIVQRFGKLPEGHRLIVTTEKDAARLATHPALSEALKPHIAVIPIEIEILQNQQDKFNQNIIGYVRKNSRNS